MDPFVLNAIGVTPAPRVFPDTALCPGCGGILAIELDDAHTGYWLHCHQCEARGNLVEFAASLWKCETDQACSRLRDMLPTSVGKWIDRQHLDSTLRRQTLRLFDDEPTRKLLYSDGLLRLAISRRGLDVQRPGVIDYVSHLVHACEPGTLRAAVVERPSATDRKRVSRCHGNVAMFAIWDRPGRAVGALTIRTATNEEVFVRMKPASNAGGLMFAHLMPHQDPDFWLTVFAKIDDPWTVARLHYLERFYCGGTRLPLAAVSTTMASPAHGFRWEDRPLIVWADQLNVAAIVLAKRLAAKLSIVPCTANELTPRNWLRNVEKAACDWRQALQELVTAGSSETIADAVQQLHLYTEDARRIACDWELSARERLLRATCNAIRHRDYLYEEHGGALLRSQGDAVEVVCHHLIRIDQVVRAPNGLHYLGRLSHSGGDLTFAEPAERFNKNADWMQDYLIMAGVVPDDFPPRKWREVARVVRRLAPPVFKAGAKNMGWEAKLGVFMFNGFQLRANGKCEESIPPTWLGPGRPTIGLLPPGPLPPAGLRELIAGHPSLPYLIAAIVARIVAPALGKKLPPLALVGDNSIRATRLAQLMGSSKPTDWHRKDPVALGWPCILTGTRQQKRKAAKRLRKATAHTVVAVTELELKALSVHQPWQRLRCPARSLPHIPIGGSEEEEVMRRIVPASLTYVCKRYRIGGLPRHKGGLVARVYKALAAWLYNQPGAEGIRAPQLRLHIDSDDPGVRATTCFAAILRELVDNEDIRAVTRHDDMPPQATEVVLLSDGSCEIYIQAIAEIVRRRSAMPLAWNRLGKALTEAKVITSWCRPETISAPDQPVVWTLTPGWWEVNVADPLAARTKQQPPPSTLKTVG